MHTIVAKSRVLGLVNNRGTISVLGSLLNAAPVWQEEAWGGEEEISRRPFHSMGMFSGDTTKKVQSSKTCLPLPLLFRG
jgi:hypothetical protein